MTNQAVPTTSLAVDSDNRSRAQALDRRQRIVAEMPPKEGNARSTEIGLGSPREVPPWAGNSGHSSMTEGQVQVFHEILARLSLNATVRPEGPGASPQAMFEAPAEQGTRRRQTALKSEFREAIEGEDASKALQETQVREAVGPSRLDSPPQPHHLHSDAGPQKVPEHGTIDDSIVGRHGPATGFPIETNPSSTLELNHRGTAASASSDPGIESSQPEAAFKSSGVQGTAPYTTATVPANQPTASTPSVAREVADVLNSPRAAKPDSPTSTATLGNSTPTDSAKTRTRQGAEATDRQAGTDSSASKLERDPAVEPTPFDRLLRSLKVRTGAQVSSARVRLDPPELGRMVVDVRMEGESLRIEVRTENDSARELVRDRADLLKSALENHGLRVTQFDVQTGLNSGGAAIFFGSGGEERKGSRINANFSDIDGHPSGLAQDAEIDAMIPLPVMARRRLDIRV